MGFAFQVIKSLPECLATSTVPLRSILRTMIFCPFRLSPWSPWLIKFRDPTAACTGTDDDALFEVDTPVWSCHLVSAFGGGGLADTTFGLYPGRIVSLFFGHFFSVPFSTELLFVSSYLTSLAFWHFYMAFIQLPSFSRNFLYLFLIYFPRWILTIFADLFGCVKLCPIQLKFFASNIRAQN